MAADYRLAEYGVRRTEDGAFIPPDERNPDWVAYLLWLRDGNTPDPVPGEPTEDVDRRARRTALRTDNVITALADATPAQVDAFIDANVTDLASARRVLKALAKAVSLLLKEGL